jgi:hypothetical protein
VLRQHCWQNVPIVSRETARESRVLDAPLTRAAGVNRLMANKSARRFDFM